MEIIRQSFCDTDKLILQIKNRMSSLRADHKKIDYITFVPDGEPTLELQLGAFLQELKPIPIPTAVITNGSMLWKPSVRKDLKYADLVSIKVDTCDPILWKEINHPHPDLDLDKVLEGILNFKDNYEGKIITETMLLRGINDQPLVNEMTAKFIHKINPTCAYLSTPTRPPAERKTLPALPENIAGVHQVFLEALNRVELLITPEEGDFVLRGDVSQEILNITALHPLSKDKLEKILQDAGEKWETVDKLLEDEKLREVHYSGVFFYIRNFIRE